MKKRWRSLRAGWRDTLILINEFKTALTLFAVTVIGGGLAYFVLADALGEPVDNTGEAIYTVLAATLLQPVGDFPNHMLLQIFHFVMPLIGIIFLAQGLTDFGVMLFNRKSRGKEWEMAVVSTMNKHIVLVGLGHLGYRVAQKLHEMGENVAVLEINLGTHTTAAAREMGIPIIQADATKPATLEAAGVPRARAIIVCTSNDTLNLQMAIKIRTLNQTARIMVRVFDEDFARQIENQFGIDYVFSASTLAAPSIAGAATQSDVSSPISLSGRALSLARFVVKKGSPLAGLTIEQFENKFDATVVLVERGGKADLHPRNDIALVAGDNLGVFAEPSTLNRIGRSNR